MAYEKRVVVLHQLRKGFSADGSALSGAVYAERLGTELTVTPRIAGIAPVKEGRYALALGIGEKTFVSELGGETIKISDSPSIYGGLRVLVVFVRGDAEPVAFGSCGAERAEYDDLFSAITGAKRNSPIPTPLPPNELPAPFSPNNVPLAPTIPVPGEDDAPFREGEYDDEAIADADYFADAGDAHARAGGAGETAQDGESPPSDEGARHPFERTDGTLTYYETVREKLAAAFASRPKDTRLLSVFPRSEWVKADGALLGVIYESGLPKYLCVAVEAGQEPPEEMKGKCCFVPASPYSDDGGFYVVFQSADTGEYVTVKEG